MDLSGIDTHARDLQEVLDMIADEKPLSSGNTSVIDFDAPTLVTLDQPDVIAYLRAHLEYVTRVDNYNGENGTQMTARGLKHGIAAWILDEIGEETSCEMLDLTDQNVRSYLQTLSDEVLPQAENGMIVKKRLKGVLKYDMTRFTTVRSRCAYLSSTLARDTKNHSLGEVL